MLSNIYWITGPGPFHLATMPCPRGGKQLEEDIRALQSDDVDILVSLLSPDEIKDLDLAEEPDLCRAHGIEYRPFPIEDRNVPSSYTAVLELTGKLGRELIAGKAIAIHCRVGIGRSSLIAACVLITNGMSAEKAFDQISDARGCHVPDTQIQRDWVESFALRLQSKD